MQKSKKNEIIGLVWAFCYSLVVFVLVSCAASATPAVPTTSAKEALPALTEMQASTAMPPTAVGSELGDAAAGAQIWADAPCKNCHGAEAQGQTAPRLAGTGLSLEQMVATVRQGRGRMPAFDESRIGDEELRHIYAWLQSLGSVAADVQPEATIVPSTNTPQSAPSETPLPPIATGLPPTGTPPPLTDTLAPLSVTPAPPTQTPIPPTDTPLPPTATPAPPTNTPVPPKPNPSLGEGLWVQAPCRNCHGTNAEGGVGPRLAGTGLSYDQLRATVRLGRGQMPAFSAARISDEELLHIHAWLQSLAPPSPTPIARPAYPTQALLDTWYFVNEMRIRADFAKDLPVRIAQDEAGRLKVVQDYAGDGLDQANRVLSHANRALGEIPNEQIKEILRQVIGETQQVVNLFQQARAQNNYGAAWNLVAEAVRICRLDTLPWATQAVRDAGVVGTVRIQVVDQAGRPIPGAFVTVLTAHTPLGVRADSNGRVTLVNVAAVPALPAKAYAEGRVYHEINVNLSAGATVDGRIALPPLPRGGLAPAVANPIIQPPVGAGDAVVTFAITATDPQGRLDLAEDQIFALNPNLGLAQVLRYVGNDRYQAQVRLPGLARGLHTWYFFAVDHECHTSNIVPVSYRVQ
ncbi:MAG: c-type cytochrome [Chloroflexi bacterium]|nr:c-type cytochrome [Chloroflexota bacterium]